MFIQFWASVVVMAGALFFHVIIAFYLGLYIGEELGSYLSLKGWKKFYKPLALLINIIYFVLMFTALGSLLYFIWDR